MATYGLAWPSAGVKLTTVNHAGADKADFFEDCEVFAGRGRRNARGRLNIKDPNAIGLKRFEIFGTGRIRNGRQDKDRASSRNAHVRFL